MGDNKEFAFDVLFDDRNVVHELREALLTGFAYTDIGIACNCDNEWGQVCIIEIGSDITPSDDYADFFDDADSSFFPILPAEDEDYVLAAPPTRRRDLHDIIPEFRLPGHPERPTGAETKLCN